MIKVTFITLLVLNFLGEALASTSLILGPNGISQAGAGEMWSMHYGFAALSIASISIWAWFQRRSFEALTVALGTLLVFHAGLTISLYLAGDQQGGMILHSVLTLLSGIAFANRGKIAAA